MGHFDFRWLHAATLELSQVHMPDFYTLVMLHENALDQGDRQAADALLNNLIHWVADLRRSCDGTANRGMH